jgi:HAMP domain-containing protein
MYLVNTDLDPITATRYQPAKIRSKMIGNAIANQEGEGGGAYDNYAGIPVLGYYRWLPSLQAALVVEMPQNNVLNKALSTLLVSSLVGIFTILIAVLAVISTSRSISEPVTALAKVSEQFAAGDLNTRGEVDQKDEIGILAGSFNKMADELQGVIGNLERRVTERTRDLERQTLRLRTAAEVARDAASAPSLDELLERAGRLIRDRFNLYHTGIFLLDEKKEFAVLRASPTEAGRSLLENHHRLRVGEQGIVGRVAASGEPRIALDTGVDPVYFSNPLLSATRSEMAWLSKRTKGLSVCWTFKVISRRRLPRMT